MNLGEVSLSAGIHSSIEDGACVMEFASYVAGEPWSDHPTCACPVITAFMIAWNDGLPTDADRDRLLKPLIPKIISTRSTLAVEERRSYLSLDWLIRVHTPKWLDLAPSLHAHAKALRDLDEIVDIASATAAGKVIATAKGAARGAVWDEAEAAIRATAGTGAWAAARSVAWDAAEAAAGTAAWDAAWAAAWGAPRTALHPTVQWLQASALDLVDRMIAVQP